MHRSPRVIQEAFHHVNEESKFTFRGFAVRYLDGRAGIARWLGNRWHSDGNCRTERPVSHPGSHCAATAAHRRSKSANRSNAGNRKSGSDKSEHGHHWDDESKRDQPECESRHDDSKSAAPAQHSSSDGKYSAATASFIRTRALDALCFLLRGLARARFFYFEECAAWVKFSNWEIEKPNGARRWAFQYLNY